MPHVLRATADPNKAYIDGRVQDLITIIAGMGAHLRLHSADDWLHLNRQTLAIFDKRESKMVQRMKEHEKMLEEAAQK